MQRSRVTRIVAGFTMVAALAACGSAEKTGDDTPKVGEDVAGSLVGVTMPTRSSERWIADGDNVKAALEKLGYKVSLEYAEDKIPTQVEQIENQISQGARVLIVAAIDGTALTTQLEAAKEAGIKVISYDRLIRNTDAVDYYASFDNYKVGVQQATSLLVGLGLKKEDGSDGDAKGPFNIELFAGSPDDNNATFFYNGAMDTLKPYLDNKTLVVQSGETDFKTVATLQWKPETAQARMENVITKAYKGDTKVDGVLSPYDGMSIGILSALGSAGYKGDDIPVVTGQDAEEASVKSIIKGEQYATIYKDTRQLADVAVSMADKVLKGEEVTVNNTEDYDNGKKVVPSQLLEPVIVYKDNYKEVLVDSGYYKESDLS
ncbi:multiple monosaccharide ABC transporter substrate-binding protein [Kineosporia succinea]|uniref:Multiple sugar transport system substrate-binding protein n=1 Tax=Kineosporia succinea TaxID=84632 RepID=A0ABT9NZ59_9ACTN|nr:multiple monosaccharide ABC transporter substrate-binding protein [Kineosporia succinea]MDP9825715.1 putative multiple sugar transport system substrate-binding protein [Kineosporia succinea]